ncbi:MAG: hypothetical protein CMJ78_15095 [Planctomycetaceae bacterium]|nr:hypothetical protein [Planctomycetaceae bacterium]
MRTAILTLTSCLILTQSALALEMVPDSKAVRKKGGTKWFDIRDLGVEGQGWTDVKSPFDRLPAKAEGKVRPPVWSLSRHSAGLCVRFHSNTASIDAHWKLTSDRIAMNHMPATGVSGLGLYMKDAKGRWRWIGVGRPSKQINEHRITFGPHHKMKEFLLYLPLYNGVTEVQIGIDEKAVMFKADTRPSGIKKPVVFYGTSITQGGCASRPGMVHTAILGRWLDVPVINLGFSGNGRMEPEIADLFSELDPSIYVLDCLPNMQPPEVAAKVEPFVKTLRSKHATTPIVLVEDRSYTGSFFNTFKQKRNNDSRAALKRAFNNLTKAGDKNLYYIEGENLLGDDGEGTVDSSHPTDLGFMRQATEFRKVLEPILKSRFSK